MAGKSPIYREVLSTARRCLGTPFRHQGRVLGVGMDCAGLIIFVARELGFAGEFFEVPYGRYPNAGTLRSLCDRYLDPIARHEPGDIVLMAWQQEPQHLAIVTDIGIIHSYAAARKVVEHSLDTVWASRIRGSYRYRGIRSAVSNHG